LQGGNKKNTISIMMRKTFFLVMALATLSIWIGCNGDSMVSNSQTGVLQGKVDIGPLCPVEQPGNCPPDPSLFTSHQLVILSADQKSVVTKVPIKSDGSYSVQLPAGTYYVDYTPHDIGIGAFSPLKVTVEAGQVTNFDIHIDTGIR
jgi:hypothetical protein